MLELLKRQKKEDILEETGGGASHKLRGRNEKWWKKGHRREENSRWNEGRERGTKNQVDRCIDFVRVTSALGARAVRRREHLLQLFFFWPTCTLSEDVLSFQKYIQTDGPADSSTKKLIYMLPFIPA